jgi:acetyltransferase-like isoleucine patch superfamily enzyme
MNEIADLGLKSVGNDVKISRWARFYGGDGISIGDNVRIDDFCVLSGIITIGSNVHISAYCGLHGMAGIEIGDYAGLSPKTTIFSETDDFTGEHLVGPMVPKKYRGVFSSTVIIGNYVQVGASSILMPGVNLGEGCAVASLSFVNSSFDPWQIIGGIPARFLKARKKNILELVHKLNNDS